MSGTLINLIIQIIAGVVGGYAAGATLKNYTFGTIGNTIAGSRIEFFISSMSFLVLNMKTHIATVTQNNR